MPRLRAHGLSVTMPDGFEGRIFRRAPVAGSTTYAVVHVATFPLPDEVADFGGGAVTLMGRDDVFVVLFEYGPESIGTALFARQGIPRYLAPSDFSTTVLRRGVPGHAGTQQFFTESGRPFTLYAVVGSSARRAVTVPKVNSVLAGITVQPASTREVARVTSAPTSLERWAAWN